jgi:hypothetical protein
VGQACESAAVRRVARQFGMAARTVRAIDLRYLERWAQGRQLSIVFALKLLDGTPGTQISDCPALPEFAAGNV